jgi:hypothetical protein
MARSTLAPVAKLSTELQAILPGGGLIPVLVVVVREVPLVVVVLLETLAAPAAREQ